MLEVSARVGKCASARLTAQLAIGARFGAAAARREAAPAPDAGWLGYADDGDDAFDEPPPEYAPEPYDEHPQEEQQEDPASEAAPEDGYSEDPHEGEEDG